MARTETKAARAVGTRARDMDITPPSRHARDQLAHFLGHVGEHPSGVAFCSMMRAMLSTMTCVTRTEF